ncbi:efflux RND transporter permease subunit [Odoribacter lunatus]|uniref:efflux RND transporter permease subunit n=1 Tax=Odoribacter lunatus TaxID=2941335 RepID=UPI0020408A72|nr:efflux RND transporter permease subunit [Odoribacter lunatus]
MGVRETKRRLSPFSVILTMAALMVVGVSMIPMLNIRYTPSFKQQELTLSFNWYGASARIIEQEVTSKIEGVLASVKGIEEMKSVTGKGSGRITLAIKKQVNIDAIRFEIATLIKQLYPRLPEQVTYPTFSTNTSGEEQQTLISYTLNAPIATSQIQKYAEEHIIPVISRLDGVNNVEVYGATPYEWEIQFNPNKCAVLNITAEQISQAVNTFHSENILGLTKETTTSGDTLQIRVLLVNNVKNTASSDSPEQQNDNTVYGYEMWENIPVANQNGRIIYLKDIATIQYKEQLPTHYYRINGLNNINLSVTAEKHINTLEVSARIKEEMKKLEARFPENYSAIIAYDSSKEIQKELNKIYIRTIMSTLILLLFVYAVSRKLRYLFLIVVTLLANVLLAFIFYNLFNLEIHLYSMAGITVSLGLIIDTSIIMIDHYSYYHNRKAFLAILAALLTTIGALTIVFFLPENQRNNLVDFSSVIIINLTVSLLIALLFIPALLDKLPITPRKSKKLIKSRRRLVKFTRLYGKFITHCRRPRFKWLLIVLILLTFGLPVHLLPTKLKDNKDQELKGFFPELYNNTIGGKFYQNTLKPYLEPLLGGTLRLFTEHVFNGNYYSDPQRTRLYVRASMPEGCTVHQMNDVMLKMENFLSQYQEIEMYQSYVYNYDNAGITITFHPKAENSSFPVMLKDILIAKANDLGGADWSIYGIGQGFSNALGSGYKSNQIRLTGYNYDMLYAFAEQLCDTLKQNKRVSAPEIMGSDSWRSRNFTEYFIDFDFEQFARQDLQPKEYYHFLVQQLYRNNLTPVLFNNEQIPVSLVSSENRNFDIWHLKNDIITMNERSIKLADLGKIEKRRSGNDIYKTNQVYSLLVAYDFLGPYELAKRVMERTIKNMNNNLPLGFKADKNGWNWNWSAQKKQYALLFLVIAIIYMVCAILFESLWQPLVIILMIPISFIGVFLTFYLFKFTFDQGGFASFVLLCGIVVNAGIYIINEYNLTCQTARKQGLKYYLKSYNHKIIPIFLTIISTILGLIPFVYEGSKEVFWFSFAVGAMGGMVFSIVALLLYLPLFMKFKERK